MLQMLPPVGQQALKMYTTLAILCSGSSPLVKFYHGPEDQALSEDWLPTPIYASEQEAVKSS